MKMIRNAAKITAIISFFVICFSSGASAQEQQTSQENKLHSKFGIKGGVNLTNLYVNDVSDEHMKVGFNAGVFAKLAVARGFSIQPELLYTVKGAKENYNNFLQGNGEYRFNLNYIELPLLAVINIGKNFNIHAGGYAAYLVSANIKDVNSNGTINGATDLNEDNFQRWDAGLAGGLGFDIQNLSIGARYNYGLAEIGKSGNLSGELTKNSKNAGLSIYLGLAF
ncbi:MAG: PorT family protein [Chitinophagaceae bacterium]|nr:PorT family protein [Chitinophagaceae bacterium]